MIKSYTIENKTVSIKGQKIIAALFLVTNHLSETDPMRLKLRSLAVELLDGSIEERQHVANGVSSLLEASFLARLINEGNIRIIEAELKYFSDPLYQADSAISSLFPGGHSDKGHFLPKRTHETSMSFITKESFSNVSEKKHLNKVNKSNRQEKILSYINDRKSANIKDISMLFSDVSEKTIQRELGVLVANGKITKRGNKRWSIYLAV